MALSGFYHNKPWLKGSGIMHTALGDLFVNLYLLVYGCRWPGLGMYKNHFRVAMDFNATVLRYEDIWTGNITDDVINAVFLSADSYKLALESESKENKTKQFQASGDAKSIDFLKEYNRTVIIYNFTKKILKIRAGEVWYLYND